MGPTCVHAGEVKSARARHPRKTKARKLAAAGSESCALVVGHVKESAVLPPAGGGICPCERHWQPVVVPRGRRPPLREAGGIKVGRVCPRLRAGDTVDRRGRGAACLGLGAASTV